MLVTNNLTLSRKEILERVVGGTVVGAMLSVVGTVPALVNAKGVSDTDILNFALNLEYLEAEFYNYAVNGKGIDQQGVTLTGTGTLGPTQGGAQVSLSDPMMFAVAQQLAYDELSHVQLLRSALGKDAIAKPAINLAALELGFRSPAEFLTLARAFEDTGMSAYGGAAPLITSKDVLGTAARILAAEAQHTGALRLLVAQNRVPTKPLDANDIIPPPSGSQFFSVDKNALATIRTPEQVLAIVKPFFPSGLNGAIK